MKSIKNLLSPKKQYFSRYQTEQRHDYNMNLKITKGIFLSFEGIDGCGKTTQAKRLLQWFEAHHLPAIYTREPGGTKLGKEIRHLLLNEEIDPCSELLLFLADRREHLQKVILPAIQSGKIVICDRFHDSTVAYQEYGRGINLDIISPLVKEWLVQPDYTFFLDISFQKAKKRQQLHYEQANHLDHESQSFFERVIEGYHQLASQYPQRIYTIDATPSQKEIFQQILKNSRFLNEID